jgi:hypothetical protein
MDLVLQPEKRDMAYAPSYALDRPDLGEEHRRIGELVAEIPGLLRPQDELKLYELAFFAPGPILEIGTYRGRSTTIMARAAQAGAGAVIFSVDVDPAAQRAATAALDAHGLARRVILVRGSATAALRRLAGLRPSLVFVDGDHSLEGVRRDLAALEPVVPDGSLLLFHDFHDPRNEDESERQIAVQRAVDDSWVAETCEFAGVFGCCGLFRRARGGASGAGATTVNAVWRDSPRMQYLQRVRWPLGRFARHFIRRR